MEGGKSTPSTFDVLFVNCKVEELEKSVQLVFSGTAASFDHKNKTVEIVGTTFGASVQITSPAGQVIILGEPSTLEKIQGGNSAL